MNSTLSDKIISSAGAMRQNRDRDSDHMEGDLYERPPKAVREPTVRDVLNQRLQAARAQVNTAEMLLNDMPDGFLKLPMSAFHSLF